MARRKSKSAINGRWNIVSMTEWDEEYLHEESPAFIEFNDKGSGEFHFGYVQTYRNVCGWHERIGFDEMVDHRILAPDRMVQETRLSSGWNVVVNFRQSDWSDERGFRVAPCSYHFFNSSSGYEPMPENKELDN